MADLSLDRTREAARRGKDASPKRPRGPACAVVDPDGRHVAVLHGPGLTLDDVDQARAFVAVMPDYRRAVTT